MALQDNCRIFIVLCTVVFESVTAQEDVNYVIASSTVAILLFFLCFVIGCVFFNCSAIYRSFGYERIPKHEIKRREVARRVASHTSSQQYLTPIQTYDKDDVSWVQRWQDHDLEERQDAVMQLGPEVPEAEYRIETSLEDTPRTAAYKTTTTTTDETGLYAVVDKSSVKSSSVTGNGSLLNDKNIRDSTELL